jgi:hypothetical protein
VLENLVEHIGDFADETSIGLIDCLSVLQILRDTRAHWETERAAQRPEPMAAARERFATTIDLTIEGLKHAAALIDRDFPPPRPIDWDAADEKELADSSASHAPPR